NVSVPRQEEFESWRAALIEELRRVAFRSFPERIPAGQVVGRDAPDLSRLETEPGIQVRLKELAGAEQTTPPTRVLLVISTNLQDTVAPDWIHGPLGTGAVFLCEPRGMGETRWTRKNPPNYVERSHVLLGRTVDSGRVWDIIATARYLRQKFGGKSAIVLAGQGSTTVLAAY